MGPQLKSAAYFTLKRLTGSRVYRHLRWFERLQYAEAAELRRLQTQLLTQLCRHAAKHVPAYRQRFAEAQLDPSLLAHDPDALRRVRPVVRYDLVNDAATFTSQQRNRVRRFRYVSTGGSSGTPLWLGQDEHFRDWCLASSFLFNSWFGLRVGQPFFFLWGAPWDLAGQRERWTERFNMGFLHGRHVLSATRVDAVRLETFLREINQTPRCHYLIGYANEAYNLACHSLERGPSIARPFERVVTTAEQLTPSMRRTIEQAFGCQVLNRYGCRDVGDIASECEHQNGLHVNPLYTRVEIVREDGTPVPDGEEGLIVVTSLHNHVMPLIRYAVGDRGVMRRAAACPCGRHWDTIVKLTGRANEALRLPHGGHYRAGLLSAAFDRLPLVHRYQIYQESETSLRIRLRTSVPNYTARFRQELEDLSAQLRRWTGIELRIVYEQTDRFQKTRSGKEPFIVHAE